MSEQKKNGDDSDEPSQVKSSQVKSALSMSARGNQWMMRVSIDLSEGSLTSTTVISNFSAHYC